jgi:hypothetical protein
VIVLLKVAEMTIDDLEQRAFVKEPGPVSCAGSLHKSLAKQETCRGGPGRGKWRVNKPTKGPEGFLSRSKKRVGLLKGDENWTAHDVGVSSLSPSEVAHSPASP